MKKKRKLKTKVRTLLVFIVAIVLFGYVSFSMINYNVYKNKYEIEQEKLEEKLHQLKDKETDLNQEISKLKDDDYLARYAREEYLYSKDGEYVIRIEDEEETNVIHEAEVKSSTNILIYVLVAVAIGAIIFVVARFKNIFTKKVSFQ